MRYLKPITLFVLFFNSSSSLSKDLFSGMSDEMREKTGINKLTKKELNTLVKWLNSDEKETIQKAIIKEEIIKEEKKKTMGFRLEESSRVEIKTNIVGSFNGWKGKNIFKLENGQVWKQAESSSFYIPKRNNPKVTIKPKSMGSWMLYVDGFGRGVKVKRVK